MSGSWEDEFMEKYEEARPDEFQDEFGGYESNDSLFDDEDDFEDEKLFDDLEDDEDLEEDF